jgi:hypothetical protein
VPSDRRRSATALILAALALVAVLWLALRERSASDLKEPEIRVEEASPALAPDPAAPEPALTARAFAESTSPSLAEAPNALRLRAVHADGRPAPDIGLAVRRAPGGSQLFQVSTNARGEAIVADARAALQDAAASALLEVAATAILPEPPALPLDPRRCFEEVLVLTLPPLAELVLRVTRADGAPLAYGSAEVMTQAECGGTPPRHFGAKSFPWWQEVEAGVVRFSRIQAEIPLFFAAQDAAWGLEARAAHAGLTCGAATEVELRFDVGRCLVRARVIDGATSSPLANAHLAQTWIVVEPTRSQSSSRTVKTDEHGVFYFDPTAPKDAIELALEIGDPAKGREIRAVPLGLGLGVHDLGDLVLAPHPPRVAGRVLDEHGAPLPRAAIDARVELEPGSNAARLRLEHLTARLYTDAEGRFAWNAPPISSDGALVSRTMLALTAYGETSRSPVVRVPYGARDVELVPVPVGGFTGHIEPDPRVPMHVLFLEHRVAGDDSAGAWTRLFARDTFVEANGLDAGRYDFRVRLAETEECAVWVRDIEVRSGETTRDPRLEPLDVRDAFRVFEFEIVHPPDCVPYDLRFTLSRATANGELRLRGSMVSATRAATLAPPGTYDASIEAPGFRTVVLRDLQQGCRVVLEPAHTLRLRLDASAAERQDGGALELVLRRSETSAEIVRAIDPSTVELVVPLSQAGRYDLVWRRRAATAQGPALIPLGAGSPAFVELRADAAVTEARVAPPRR